MSTTSEFFNKVWKAIKKFFKQTDDKLKQYLPIVINISEALKSAVENGTYDTVAGIVEAVVPGHVEDPILIGFKVWAQNNLAKIIVRLQLVNIVAHIDPGDVDAQIQAIIGYMKDADKTAVNTVYLGLASTLGEYFADGKLSETELKMLVEWYYTNLVKKQ